MTQPPIQPPIKDPFEILRFDGHLSPSVPIVLLPVRIETRFDVPGSRLLVRIYPDELSVITHEKALTPAEYQAGVDFWAEADASTAGDQIAWRRLMLTYPAPRAAWIVAATDNGAQPPLQPDRWMHAARTRVMPDRFAVRAFRGGVLVASAIGNVIPDPLYVSLDPQADTPDLEDLSGHGLDFDKQAAWTLDFDKAVAAGMAVRMPLSAADLANGFDQLFVVGLKATLGGAEGAARLAELIESHHYTRGFAFVRQGTPVHNTSEGRSPFQAPDPGGAESYRTERLVHSFPFSLGTAFARALAVPTAVIDNIAWTDLLDENFVRAFNDALWPAGSCEASMMSEATGSPSGSAAVTESVSCEFSVACGVGVTVTTGGRLASSTVIWMVALATSALLARSTTEYGPPACV